MKDPTLLIHWLFTALAILVMLARLLLKKIISAKYDAADFLTGVAIVCAATRGYLIHFVLTWGTNNLSAKAREKTVFTPEVIHERTVGSKFTIANRPVYNTYLWLQKCVILHFYLRHFMASARRLTLISWSFGIFLFTTWLAALIVGFTECNPFYLYWQVVPNPGKCVEAKQQLVVLGVLNILTDAALISLPVPILLSLSTKWRLKLRLLILCTLGIFIIFVTVIRLPINASNATSQISRTTWASTELVTAAIVVNAPVLYGLIRSLKLRMEGRGSAYHPGNSNQDSLQRTASSGRTKRRRASKGFSVLDETQDQEEDIGLTTHVPKRIDSTT